MSQRISTKLAVGLCALLLFAEVDFAQSQKKNPPVYPYGGTIDESLKKKWMPITPVNFSSRADFGGAYFDTGANFLGSKFNGDADFSAAIFPGVIFGGFADFREAKFDGEANFFGAKFEERADFVRARFGRTVNFANTDFRHGVDFRQTYFDSVEIIYLENIKFPDGKLRFYWHQFQGKDSLRIKLHYESIDRYGFH